MKKFIIYGFIFLLLPILTILIFYPETQPIKIGLMVTLTGVYPDLGREIRDGALLAVEMINEKGGINGRPIELIIRDNKYDIDIAKMSYEELVRENVVAVIGPATSTTAKNLLPLINQKKVLTIAPTPTSTELAGLDDYMIRLRPTNKEDAEVLAGYLKEKFNLKRIALVYDLVNPVYTEDFIRHFKSHFSSNVKFLDYPFYEKKDKIKEMAKKILNKSPDAVVLVMDVYNSALLIQNLKMLKPDILILSTIWALSPRLIESAGKRAEGLISVDVIDCCMEDEDYNIIQKRFTERFGRPMNFASINGFDSVMIIKKALENRAKRENMKETILRIKKFRVAQGEITFDEFGDRQEKPFIIKVQNGKFIRVKE